MRLSYLAERILYIEIQIRASKGFDRDLEDGEAIRSRALNGKPKLNANDKLALAA